MAMEIKITEEAQRPLSMHPKKFALWLFIVSVVMLFGAWTSAYIVKRGDAGWVEVIIPGQFLASTIIIVLSSMSMIVGYIAAKKDNLVTLRIAIIITTLLGFGFLGAQFMGWQELIKINEYFSGGNVSHSFIWVFTFFHALHIIGGLVYLLIVLNAAVRLKIHSKNLVHFEMCSTYWHFLGVLWVYLYVFLLLNG